MSELDKITAWANAAKGNPVLQALFPPSTTPDSGKFFLWAGHFEEYEPGRWQHPGLDYDADGDGDAADDALSGDGIEEYTLLQWATLGQYAYLEAKSGKFTSGALRTQAINYQWFCAHPDIAATPRMMSEVVQWAEGRVMSEDEITAALLTNPVSPVFPDDQQLQLFEEAPHV